MNESASGVKSPPKLYRACRANCPRCVISTHSSTVGKSDSCKASAISRSTGHGEAIPLHPTTPLPPVCRLLGKSVAGASSQPTASVALQCACFASRGRRFEPCHVHQSLRASPLSTRRRVKPDSGEPCQMKVPGGRQRSGCCKGSCPTLAEVS
jgi:hypothetical protein